MFFLAYYVALMNLFNPKSGLLALIQVRTYFWPSDTECKESRDSSRKKKLLSKRYRIDIIHLSNLRAKYCFYKICKLGGSINEFQGFEASLFIVDIILKNLFEYFLSAILVGAVLQTTLLDFKGLLKYLLEIQRSLIFDKR